jgi:hypothetical protein
MLEGETIIKDTGGSSTLRADTSFVPKGRITRVDPRQLHPQIAVVRTPRLLGPFANRGFRFLKRRLRVDACQEPDLQCFEPIKVHNATTFVDSIAQL